MLALLSLLVIRNHEMVKLFHPSLELGQHGKKSLDEALQFAKSVGCEGAQPSCYHLQNEDGSFMSPEQVRAAFDKHQLRLDGISSHCVFWVHGTAWTSSPTIRPFIPQHLHHESVERIEAWAEDYLLRLMDLSAALDRKVIPMFWGLYCGWELATGYPWGFFSGPGYDLPKEAEERFVKKTERLLSHASELGLVLAHEVHPNTGAACSDDFLNLYALCGGNDAMGVFADPSHCWEGEDFEARFSCLEQWVYGAHVKDFRRVRGKSLRSQQSLWQERGMQFTRLGEGEVDIFRFVQLLIDSDLNNRWNELHGTTDETIPLVAEAESAYVALDAASAHGVKFVSDHLCYEVAEGSFEDGMGDS